MSYIIPSAAASKSPSVKNMSKPTYAVVVTESIKALGSRTTSSITIVKNQLCMQWSELAQYHAMIIVSALPGLASTFINRPTDRKISTTNDSVTHTYIENKNSRFIYTHTHTSM